jgi:hypothetical protein
MNWDFSERLGKSFEGDARTAKALRWFFSRATDFNIDWSPREKPYGHDLEIRAFSQTYKIEEKRRQKDYGDELLEDISNDVSGRKGWTWRAGEADYVLFIYPERWTIWPGKQLADAFQKNREAWIRKYGTRAAQNNGYKTINVPIPTDILKLALSEAGAPICPHCECNVGRFSAACEGCGLRSCCAITEEGWVCEWCVDLGIIA